MIGMNSNTSTPAAASSAPEFALVAALLTALSDPKAAQARLADIAGKIDEANTLRAAVHDEQQALERQREETSRQIAADLDKTVTEIAQRRATLDADIMAADGVAKQNAERAADLEKQAMALADREADLTKRETNFRRAADAIRGVAA